jgi:hypothetical protein
LYIYQFLRILDVDNRKTRVFTSNTVLFTLPSSNKLIP